MMLYINNHQIELIYIFIINVNFFTLFGQSSARDSSKVRDDLPINTEEILRRRKLVEPHMLQVAEAQKSWIETYHMSFSPDALPSLQKAASEDPILIKYPVHDEIHIAERIEKTVKQKHQEKNTIHTQQKNFAGKEREREERASKIKICEDLNPSSLIESKKRIKTNQVVVNQHVKMHAKEDISEPNVVGRTSMESTKGNKDKFESYPILIDKDKQSNSHNVKMIHLMSRANNIAMFESEKERRDSNIADHPIPDKYTQNAYLKTDSSASDKKGIESDLSSDHIKTLNIFPGEKAEAHFSYKTVSNFDLDHEEGDCCAAGNMKDNFLHIIKKLSDSNDKDLNRHDISFLYEISYEKHRETNYPISKCRAEKNVEDEFVENSDLTDILPDMSENGLENERKVLLKPFFSSLNHGKESWIETYDFNFKATDSEEIHKSVYSGFEREENRYYHREVDKSKAYLSEPVKVQERVYYHRWLKKLLNKVIDYPSLQQISISFFLTADSLNDLKLLSESSDIKKAEHLFSDLILNANVHYGYNLSYLLHSYAVVVFYIIAGIVLCVLLYFILLYYRFARLLLIFLFCILWHGWKMYQEKVAEKHATMTSSSPEYCESILVKESGVLDHFKEFIRYHVYHDHCQKYFEALMIDPLSELSISIVVSDFVSSTFFQLFRPMGRALNTLAKDLFKDLSFVQKFYLIILLFFIFMIFIVFTLIYNKYKLNLPFFMGSVEPSIAVGGSRVEDVSLKPCVNEDSPLKLTVSKNSDISSVQHRKYCTVSTQTCQDNCQHEISRPLVFRKRTCSSTGNIGKKRHLSC